MGVQGGLIKNIDKEVSIFGKKKKTYGSQGTPFSLHLANQSLIFLERSSGLNGPMYAIIPEDIRTSPYIFDQLNIINIFNLFLAE